MKPDEGGIEGARVERGRIFQENKPYGDPMRDAMATGDLNEMRRVHAYAGKWLQAAEAEIDDVRNTLRRLEEAIADLEG
jgi:hypothetical protein